MELMLVFLAGALIGAGLCILPFAYTARAIASAAEKFAPAAPADETAAIRSDEKAPAEASGTGATSGVRGADPVRWAGVNGLGFNDDRITGPEAANDDQLELTFTRPGCRLCGRVRAAASAAATRLLRAHTH